MNRSLRVAVVGAGRWGPNLIRNFQNDPLSEVSMVCDQDEARLNAIARHYSGIRTTKDWKVAVSDPDTQAVVICTPTVSHYQITKEALKQGKHVFVEKPLTNSYQQALELRILADKQKCKLMVGHVFLFNPAVQKIKEIIKSGALGDIHYIYSMRTNLGPIRGDVNALWDLGSHDISIFLYLLEQLPVQVGGYGGAFINPPIEDVVFARLVFRNGIFANLHVSWLDPKKVRQIVIVGSKKMLIFDDILDDKICILDKNVGGDLSQSKINDTIHLFRKSIFEGKSNQIPIPEAEPLKNECRAFLEWVVNHKPQPSDAQMGVNVVHLLEKISTQMRKPRDLDDISVHSEPEASLE